jgi:hypothetical protein
MQNKSNQKVFKFVKERERSLIIWKPWGMESLGGMSRNYVFRKLGVRGRYNLLQPPLQAMRTCKLKNTCKKLVKYLVSPTKETWIA